MTRQMSLPVRANGLSAARRSPAAAPTESSITAKDVLGIIRRRMWLILILTALSTLTSGALYMICLRYYPKYTSVGYIICKMPVRAKMFGTGAGMIPRMDVITMETTSKATYLRGDSFLSEVLKRAKVQGTNWFQRRQDNPEDLMEDLKDSFSASPLRDTEYVRVSMQMSSSEEAQLILDEALSAFETQMEESATRSLRNVKTALQDERGKMETKLLGMRSQLDRLNSEANVPGWQQGRTVLTDKLAALNQEITRLHAVLSETQLYKMSLEKDNRQMGVSSNVRAQIDADRMVLYYKGNIAQLAQNRELLLDRLGQEHLQVKEVQTQIDNSEKSLAKKERELLSQYTGREQRGLDKQIETTAQQLAVVQNQYNEAEAQQLELDRKMRDYNAIQEEITALNRQLERYEVEINGVSAELRDPDRVRAEVHTRATKPLRRSSPQVGFFVPAGFVIGLLVSAGLSFLLEFMDDSVKLPSDVSRHLRMPLLGMVPLYDEDEEEDAEEVCVATLASSKPRGLLGEFYRQLRTNLFFSAPAGEIRTTLVTGSGASCGTTTTAVNLAITLAAEGKRVLLVDGNFRRPRLNRIFVAEGAPRGLSNMLVGQCTAADVIRPSGIDNLDVMDSGPPPPNPADLLSGRRMSDFLASQKDYYDHTIVDGPPSLVVTDSRILATQMDGTIVVVRAAETPRGVVQRMIRELKTGDIRILGVVLNGVKPRKGGYFEKAYQSYYDYVGPVGEVGPVAALASGEAEENGDEKADMSKSDEDEATRSTVSV